MQKNSARFWMSLGWGVATIALVMLALHPSFSPPSQYGADKAIHFIVFSFMVGFPMWLFRGGLWFKFVLFFLLIGMGCGIEYVQSFVPYRSASLADAFANFSGGLFGTVLALTKLWQESRAQRR